MKYLKLIFFITLLLNISCNFSASEDKNETNSYPELSANLNEYFDALTKIKKFNGSVFVQKDGEKVIYKAFNMNADPTSSLHVQENSQFDIHSISKLMAKACIVKMEQADLISREDKVNKFIPDFPNGELISIEHLLLNQSGLPRDLSEEQKDLIEKSPEELVELIKKEKLLFTPGTETLYSNIGYELIYYIIYKITKKPFVQYVNDEFFEPLGMKDSGAHFYLNKNNLTRLAKNHIIDEGEILTVPNIFNEGKNQAKIYSTKEDLMKFIDHIKDEPYRSKLKNKKGTIGWSGGGEGIRTHASAILDSGYELVWFANYEEIPFSKILDDVEKIMTKQTYDLPKEINRKSVEVEMEVMKRYVGKYDMAEFNHHEFELRIEKDSFTFYQNGERNTVLLAENDSTFFYDPKSSDSFVFQKDGADKYKLVFNWKGINLVGKKK